MKARIYVSIIYMATLLLTMGCTDWLDQEPQAKVTEAAYFKNLSDFEAAANKLYSQVYTYKKYDEGTDLSYLLSVELSATNGAALKDDFYKQPYEYLRSANTLLAQVDKYAGMENIDIPVGQAYFYRAWWHFYLLQRFGGVTLSLAVPQTDSEFVFGPRNSRYEVIAQILQDLDKAQTLLKDYTKGVSGNSGALTVEAACAFKARVCLFEATWEKYNGRGAEDVTNGDGTSKGAGTMMPEGYPSVNDLFTMAVNESAKFVSGGLYASEYSIWMEAEDHKIDAFDRMSSYYLFNLEESDSNPYSVTKATNNESIFRRCFDYTQQSYGGGVTHAQSCSGSRKLIDMFLCADGLPVNKSSLFQGYYGVDSEFENRDARMTSLFKQVGHYYWSGNGEHGRVAPTGYSEAPSASNTSSFLPSLNTSGRNEYGNNNQGYIGRKFTDERERPAGQLSADYMLIRLPEMLLVNVEALYELNGKITDAELASTVNLIRKRAHIADLTNALVANNGLDMLEEIRRERAVEFFGEDFRLTDLCRWGIAEKELVRPTCIYYVAFDGQPTELASYDGGSGSQLYNAEAWSSHMIDAEQPQSTYTAGMPTVKPGALIVEHENNRLFTKKNYLQSIPLNEIQLNSKLLQNPEW